MPEESYSFSSSRVRLEEIVTQVRKKDTSLEKSLDLLEEGVRLANQCTELIDHADWEAAGAPAGELDAESDAGDAEPPDAPEAEAESEAAASDAPENRDEPQEGDVL